MKIKIEKSEDHYRADCLDLPGSPPVGLGDTPEMAVACLFWRMLFLDTEDPSKKQWVDYLKEKRTHLTVNGKEWDWPESYKRER